MSVVIVWSIDDILSLRESNPHLRPKGPL